MSVRARTYHEKFMYGNVLAPKIICQPLYQPFYINQKKKKKKHKQNPVLTGAEIKIFS